MLSSSRLSLEQTLQVLPIAVLRKSLRQFFKLLGTDEAFMVSGFFRASYFQALAVLNSLDEIASFNQAFMGASV